MPIYMSEDEARRSGLLTTAKKSAHKKGAGRREKGATRCATCKEPMAGETAEENHNAESGHARFEMILEGQDVQMG